MTLPKSKFIILMGSLLAPLERGAHCVSSLMYFNVCQIDRLCRGGGALDHRHTHTEYRISRTVLQCIYIAQKILLY